MAHPLCHILWLETSPRTQPTLQGQGLHKGLKAGGRGHGVTFGSTCLLHNELFPHKCLPPHVFKAGLLQSLVLGSPLSPCQPEGDPAPLDNLVSQLMIVVSQLTQLVDGNFSDGGRSRPEFAEHTPVKCNKVKHNRMR